MVREGFFVSDVTEEIALVFVSFFSLSYDEQERAFGCFVKDRYRSDTEAKRESEKLFKIAGCLCGYKPDNIPVVAYERWWDLAAILDRFAYCEYPPDLVRSPRIWSLAMLKDDRVWEVVRRLAKEVLDEWGVSLFKFGKKIDLDDLELEEWWV